MTYGLTLPICLLLKKKKKEELSKFAICDG